MQLITLSFQYLRNIYKNAHEAQETERYAGYITWYIIFISANKIIPYWTQEATSLNKAISYNIYYFNFFFGGGEYINKKNLTHGMAHVVLYCFTTVIQKITQFKEKVKKKRFHHLNAKAI